MLIYFSKSLNHLLSILVVNESSSVLVANPLFLLQLKDKEESLF